MENCVNYMYGIAGITKKKNEYPELCKFNRNLCTLYVRIIWICKKIEYPESRKFDGKLCILYV